MGSKQNIPKHTLLYTCSNSTTVDGSMRPLALILAYDL